MQGIICICTGIEKCKEWIQCSINGVENTYGSNGTANELIMYLIRLFILKPSYTACR